MIYSIIISYEQSKNKTQIINILNYLYWLLTPEWEILLVEQGEMKDNNWLKDIKKKDQINYIFVKKNKEFNKQYGYDIGVRNAKGSILIFHDINIYIKLSSYLSDLKFLNRFDIINPYRRICYLDSINTNIFFNNNYNFGIVRNNKIDSVEVMCEGIFMIKKDTYSKIRIDNGESISDQVNKLGLTFMLVTDIAVYINDVVSNVDDVIEVYPIEKKIENTFVLTRTIPKKIFFYWDGSDLSWMRYMTLYSFRKLNPDWNMTLYLSDGISKNKGWKTSENQDYYTYNGNNYINKLKDLNIKIEKAEFPKEIQGLLTNLSPIHKSDLFRYYQLFVGGGFYCDMDVLFFKSIDNFYNEVIQKGYDTIIHEYQSKERTLTIGFLGSSINNEYYKNLFEFGVNYYTNNIKNDDINNNYQSMGVLLIYMMFTNKLSASRVYETIISKYPNLKFYNLPTSLIYSFDWTKIKYCFSNSIKSSHFAYNSIGYHWYGGGVESQKYNNILTEKNYKDHRTTFSTIAQEVINLDKQIFTFKKEDKPKISIVMSSFNRPELLNLGLLSISKQKIDYPLEIVVVNDGMDDNTEKICDSYRKKLNIKYIFSGHRNSKKLISRTPAIPINIGIKNAIGDIIILTCPEIYHLNDCVNTIIKPLLENDRYLSIPKFMYFDDLGEYTNNLLNNTNKSDINTCKYHEEHSQMPFLMGIWKEQIMDIGGYDEDFTGYACDDNDFVDRLKLNGCTYYRVDAEIVHLYHGERCSGFEQWNNPEWVYNYKLYKERKDTIVRNLGREWGNNIRISIVIAYYNRKKLFYETLKSIEKSKFKNIEVIVVDDGSSSDERLEEFISEFPFLNIIRIEPENKWYVNPCIPFNIGIHSAIGDIIVIQNPECLHLHDVLTYINENIDDTKYITFSTFSLDKNLTNELPKYIKKNMTDELLNNLPQSLVKTNSETFEHLGWFNHSKYSPTYYHFCSAITKKNMYLLNGFDERFAKGISYDDNEFIERVGRLGLTKIIVDDVSVVHQWHPSIFYNMDNTLELQEKNRLLFQDVVLKEKTITVNQ